MQSLVRFVSNKSGMSLRQALLSTALGFGLLGPMMGSVAAAWQSKMGVAGAGSLFAVLQAAVMTGVSKSAILSLGFVISSAHVNVHNQDHPKSCFHIHIQCCY